MESSERKSWLDRPVDEAEDHVLDPIDAHIELMTRSEALTEDDLSPVAMEWGYAQSTEEVAQRARARVAADQASARASSVMFTPTFFINGRRYDGPWDQVSLSDAMLSTLGHRVRSAALDFASWGPSAGILLLLATVIAVFAASGLAAILGVLLLWGASEQSSNKRPVLGNWR